MLAAAVDSGGRFFGKTPDPEKCKHYYVAAEPTQWDYAPSGRDEICGAVLPPSYERERQVGKLRYFQYTDATFATRVAETPSLGILGPVMRGMVGEFLVVTFLNRSSQPLSMHPHGVRYDKDSEGAFYRPGAGQGASVAPGDTFTYVWQLDESSGPRPDEPSSKGWLYHSHVAGDEEINQGLVGVIIVTDPKRARADGTPLDVDRELAALFMIFDESGLGAEAKEAYEYVNNGSGIPVKSWAEIQETMEIGSRTGINGRTFGNLPGLVMNEGERVRWYVFGLGSQQDFHTAHWHGQRVVEDGRRRTDVVEVLPGSMKVVDMLADNPGDWLFHCHVADHMREGMFARMTVYSKESVGTDRSPERAFLGLLGDGTNSSLHFANATFRWPNKARTEERRGELQFEVTATVPDAFTVFRSVIRVQIGDAQVEFSPDRKGAAKAAGAAAGSLQILNSGAQGVVYGNSLTFVVTLDGPVWNNVGRKVGGSPAHGEPAAKSVPVVLTINDARHNGTVVFQTVEK